MAYQRFYQGLPFIVEALEVMGYKRHIEKYGETYLDWEPKVRSEAQQIVTSITSFSFIVTFMAVYQYLSHLSGITVKLQKTSLDIIKAHELVNEVNALQGGASICGRWVLKDFSAEHPSGGESWC